MTGRGGIGLLRLRARALLRRHPRGLTVWDVSRLLTCYPAHARGALSHPWFDVVRGNGCWLYTLRGQG